MYYYEVLVGDMQYHGEDALTYSSEEHIVAGTIVRVALRARAVLAIVVRSVREPSFTTKPISAIAPYPPMPHTSLQLLQWLRGYYPAPLGSVVRQVLPPSTSFPKETTNSGQQTSSDIRQIILPPLTPEQTKALAVIGSPGSYLLHGITGSGKSRVYLELARRTLAAGRSVLMLTPEIGLTTQLTSSFVEQFGKNCVVVLHSAMTAATRRDTWYRLLSSTEPLVVVGPRSALFSPLSNLGLVVLDEAHDQAYKNESAPHYHAGRVAAVLARLHTAIYVSGSATPNVEDYYVAQQKERPIVRLSELATKSEYSAPEIISVDLKDQNNFGRSRILSNELVDKLTTTLANHEQSLLFLNRRGTANVVL